MLSKNYIFVKYKICHTSNKYVQLTSLEALVRSLAASPSTFLGATPPSTDFAHEKTELHTAVFSFEVRVTAQGKNFPVVVLVLC